MLEDNSRASGISIERSLQILDGIANDELREVVSIIDDVDGDGVLPRIPLSFVGSIALPAGCSVDGTFLCDIGDHGELLAQAIVVRFDAPHRWFVALHEIGHVLDARGLPGNGWSSERHPLLA